MDAGDWLRLARDLRRVPIYSDWARLFADTSQLRALARLLPRGHSPAPAIFAALRLTGERAGHPYFLRLQSEVCASENPFSASETRAAIDWIMQNRLAELSDYLTAWRWHAPDTHYLKSLAILYGDLIEQKGAISLIEIGSCMGFALAADDIITGRAMTGIKHRKGCDLHPLSPRDPDHIRIAELLAWPRGDEALQLLTSSIRSLQHLDVRVAPADGRAFLSDLHPFEDSHPVLIANFVFSNMLDDAAAQDFTRAFLQAGERLNASTVIGVGDADDARCGVLTLRQSDHKISRAYAFDFQSGEPVHRA